MSWHLMSDLRRRTASDKFYGPQQELSPAVKRRINAWMASEETKKSKTSKRASEVSKSSEVSEAASGASEVSKTSEAFKTADALEAPKAPEALEAPKAPEALGAPGSLEAPRKAPKALEAPKDPRTPRVIKHEAHPAPALAPAPDQAQPVPVNSQPSTHPAAHPAAHPEASAASSSSSTTTPFPSLSPSFTPRFFGGFLIDCDVYYPDEFGASVRLYAHSPKNIVDTLDTYVIYDSYIDVLAGTPHRATFVVPQTKPCDVQVLINMAYAASVASTVNCVYKVGGTPLGHSPILSLDDNILLLQILDEEESPFSTSPVQSRESRKARTREFIDIGFHIVGHIANNKARSQEAGITRRSPTGDLTAGYCVYNGAVILQAKLRTLLTNDRVHPDKSSKFQ